MIRLTDRGTPPVKLSTNPEKRPENVYNIIVTSKLNWRLQWRFRKRPPFCVPEREVRLENRRDGIHGKEDEQDLM